MYQTYLELATRWPAASAFVHFAVLATLGELLASIVSRKGLQGGFAAQLGRALAWGVVGVVAWPAGTGFGAFARSVLSTLGISAGLTIPGTQMTLLAVSRGFCTSLFLGPPLLLLSRLLDNAITRRGGFQGMKPAMVSLAWLWFPALSVYFSMTAGIAASIASAALTLLLGLVSGLGARGARPSKPAARRKAR